MCDHTTSVQLQRTAIAVASAHVDYTTVGEVYDMHAPVVYGVLHRVMQCEDCASEVLLHTFVKVCTRNGAQVTLAVLLRSAFASACAAADAVERPALEGRIKAWYSEALADRPRQMIANT